MSSQLPEEEPVKEKNLSKAGLKVYFGGFKFDDIDDAAKNNDEWDPERIEKVKAMRVARIKSLITRFGPVEAWEDHWDKGYTFAVLHPRSPWKLFHPLIH